MNKPKYYITTAIAYASAKPHIGNTYEAIATDSIARYRRLRGYDVFFCTGTDEHGQKIENLANDKGITPKQYVDNAAAQIKAEIKAEVEAIVAAGYGTDTVRIALDAAIRAVPGVRIAIAEVSVEKIDEIKPIVCDPKNYCGCLVTDKKIDLKKLVTR